MSDNQPEPAPRPAWRSSRYGLAVCFLLSLLAVWFALRVILFLQFRPRLLPSTSEVLWMFLDGVHRDFYVALLFTVPLLFWFLIVPNRWFTQVWHRMLLGLGLFLFWLGEVFLLAAEYYFFDEFRSRFNTVAVDYLDNPREVLTNIWVSYPVVPVLAACGLVSLVWLVVALRRHRSMWDRPHSPGVRVLWLVGALALAAGLTRTIQFQGPTISLDRTLDEMADNGALSFARAAWTHNLDFAQFYKTMPLDAAYARVRRLLAEPNAQFVGGGNDLRQRIAGDTSRPRLNVVILLEESLGSEFWGSLGRPGESLTPQMDKLTTEEGWLFTNIYACGNRTVRGFEGVLSGFPPLPGGSIVTRDRSDNIESLARVLKRDGYSTVFFYGGRGVFDSMKPYALRNGWDRFLEHNPPFNDAFPQPHFATIWGVSDEEVYARAIQEFRALSLSGKPFLGTIMSVSNHKPYTYPRGRIPDDPDRPNPTREKVVKYSDWCLGQFFRDAKREPFWTNTVFVVVADHGARVYGSQKIPIFSYEIPLVILGPAVVKQPQRLGMLGSSLDVSPTVLGLIGRPYETLFFGRDLLHDPPEQGRALLNHNRDIGLYTRQRLVVLGLNKTVEFYQGDPKGAGLTPLESPSAADREFEDDCIALYQVADDLYTHRRYHLDP